MVKKYKPLYHIAVTELSMFEHSGKCVFKSLQKKVQNKIVIFVAHVMGSIMFFDIQPSAELIVTLHKYFNIIDQAMREYNEKKEKNKKKKGKN